MSHKGVAYGCGIAIEYGSLKMPITPAYALALLRKGLTGLEVRYGVCRREEAARRPLCCRMLAFERGSSRRIGRSVPGTTSNRRIPAGAIHAGGTATERIVAHPGDGIDAGRLPRGSRRRWDAPGLRGRPGAARLHRSICRYGYRPGHRVFLPGFLPLRPGQGQSLVSHAAGGHEAQGQGPGGTSGTQDARDRQAVGPARRRAGRRRPETLRSSSGRRRATTSTGGWLETAWVQDEPYNAFCPLDPVDGVRSYVGCVATAFAQIVHYHRLCDISFSEDDSYMAYTAACRSTPTATSTISRPSRN